MSCGCDRGVYGKFFNRRFARRVARKYRKRGLDGPSQRIADFVASRGLEGATILEIGGGVGEIQVELLKAGAARAVNLELSSGYDAEALRRAAGAAARALSGTKKAAFALPLGDSGDVGAVAEGVRRGGGNEGVRQPVIGLIVTAMRQAARQPTAPSTSSACGHIIRIGTTTRRGSTAPDAASGSSGV